MTENESYCLPIRRMEENRGESGRIEKQLAYPSKKEAYARGSPSTNVLEQCRQAFRSKRRSSKD